MTRLINLLWGAFKEHDPRYYRVKSRIIHTIHTSFYTSKYIKKSFQNWIFVIEALWAFVKVSFSRAQSAFIQRTARNLGKEGRGKASHHTLHYLRHTPQVFTAYFMNLRHIENGEETWIKSDACPAPLTHEGTRTQQSYIVCGGCQNHPPFRNLWGQSKINQNTWGEKKKSPVKIINARRIQKHFRLIIYGTCQNYSPFCNLWDQNKINQNTWEEKNRNKMSCPTIEWRKARDTSLFHYLRELLKLFSFP